MSKTRRLLRRLKLDRVDLVPTGANPDAHIALFKSGQKPDNRPISVSTHLSAGGSSLLTPWVSKEAEVPETEQTTPAEVTLTIDGEEKTFSAEQVAELHERAHKAEADVEKARKALEQRKEKAEKEDDTAAKLQEQLDKIEKERKEADEELAKLRKAERTRTFVEKAKEFEQVGPAEQIGALLEDADDNLSSESRDTLGKLLHRAKAAAAQKETAELFKQLSDSSAEPADFEEKLQKAAQERVAKSDGELTIEQAKVQVMSEDPELRHEYQEARS